MVDCNADGRLVDALEAAVADVANALAHAGPVPAAGAAAAASLAMGLGLGLKVVRLSQRQSGSPDDAEEALAQLLAPALLAFRRDCVAVRTLLSRKRTPADCRTAIEVPLQVLELARDGSSVLSAALDGLKATLISDTTAASSLMHAAAVVSYWIVRDNAAWLNIDAEGDALARASGAMADVTACHERVLNMIRRHVAGTAPR